MFHPQSKLKSAGKCDLKKSLSFAEKINMGKGDKRSKKGKITIGSYGVSRPRPSLAAKKQTSNEPVAAAKPKKAKTAAAKEKPAAKKTAAKKKAE